MRVVFCTCSLGWGGTEAHLEQLVMRLGQSIDPVIICFGPDIYRQSLNERYGLDVPIIDASDTKGFAAYRRVLRASRPDVVVFVNGKLGLFSWKAYLAARMSGARRVFAIEQLQGEQPPPMEKYRGPLRLARRLFGWRARYMLRIRLLGHLADRTICVSGAVRKTIIDDYGFPPTKTMTIFNAIDVKKFTPSSGRQGRERVRRELGIDPHADVLVCVTRLSRLKRVEVLLEAMALLRAKRPASVCIIVGQGEMREELQARAAALRVRDAVHFVGHVEDVRPYLEAGDVYVSTSEREGLPLAVAEAMAMGLVCVVTDIGGHDEVILNGVTGLLVPVHDAAAMANAVESVLSKEEFRQTASQAARKRIEAEFNLDQMVRRIEVELQGAASFTLFRS